MSMITEQIKNLRKVAEYPAADGSIKWILRGAADTIEELSSKLHTANMERSSQYYHGGWIPCEDRMPEERQSVLVYCPYGNNIYCAYLENKQWLLFGAYTNQTIKDVIAWRPLPEPYSPNTEEENADRD